MRESENVRRRDCERKKAVFAGAYNRDFRGANRDEIVRSEDYVEKFTHLE